MYKYHALCKIIRHVIIRHLFHLFIYLCYCH